QVARFIFDLRRAHIGLLHVPGRRWAALSAQPTVNTQVLVLHHDTAGLRQRRRDEQRLRQVFGWRLEPRAQIGFRAVLGDRQAIDRTDIDAGVAFDAELRREYRLYVAVQAALHFLG